MLIDLHMHSTLSDGALTIEEVVMAAERRGYDALAVTDHARGDDPGYRDLATAVRDAIEQLIPQSPIQLFAGVELTNFEPAQISRAAEDVRASGAQIVVVHGECVTMTVHPGTNAAALRALGVDLLAHPGLISPDDAAVAAARNVPLELSAKPGHCYANGHVFHIAQQVGAQLVVNSDAHDEDGLLSLTGVAVIIRGAGASEGVRGQINADASRRYERLRQQRSSRRGRVGAI